MGPLECPGEIKAKVIYLFLFIIIIIIIFFFGSFNLSGKLATYPSPKPTLTLSSYLEQNVGLGEGYPLLGRGEEVQKRCIILRDVQVPNPV